MPLQRDECMSCGEEILVGQIMVGDQRRPLLLQVAESEVVDENGKATRGHERHWKYCTARPTTGSASAEPPEEPLDEPDKVLDE